MVNYLDSEEIDVSGCLLMTGRALRCSWRFCVRPYLDNLIVTPGAGAMKSLLVGQRDYRG